MNFRSGNFDWSHLFKKILNPLAPKTLFSILAKEYEYSKEEKLFYISSVLNNKRMNHDFELIAKTMNSIFKS